MKYILVLVLTKWDAPYARIDQIEFNGIEECMFAKTQIEQQFNYQEWKFKGVCLPKGV